MIQELRAICLKSVHSIDGSIVIADSFGSIGSSSQKVWAICNMLGIDRDLEMRTINQHLY